MSVTSITNTTGLSGEDNFLNATSDASIDSATVLWTTTPSEAFLEWQKYYDTSRDLFHRGTGMAMAVICIIGVIANILSIYVLSMIIRRSKLPVYRCFLGLAVADFLVSNCSQAQVIKYSKQWFYTWVTQLVLYKKYLLVE